MNLYLPRKEDWKFSYQRDLSLLGSDISISGRKKYFSKAIKQDFDGPYEIIIKNSVFMPKKQDKLILETLQNKNVDFYIKLFKKTEKKCDELFYTVNKNIPTHNLQTSLKNCFKAFERVSPYFWIPWYVTENGLILEDVSIKQKDLQKILNSSLNGDFLQKEREDLLYLAIKRNTEKFKELLKKHHKKYSWLNQKFLSPQKELSINYFKQKIKTIKNPDRELKEHYKVKKRVEKEAKEALKRYDYETKKRLILSRKSAFTLNWSVQRIYQSCFSFNVLLNKSAEFLDIHTKDVEFLRAEEIISLNKIKKNIIKERKKGFAYIHTNRELRLRIGTDYKLIKQWTKSITKIKEKNPEIKGIGIHKGIINGRTIIIQSERDFDKVKEGNIIVCSMTSPNYVVILDKAKGWITDEGGILSHAAIISREMKKPCIVGTRIATKLLKDGDKIELNANTGIVKKI